MKRFVLAALLLHAFTIFAIACTCGPSPSPYRAYQEAQTVFIGKVISSDDFAYTDSARGRKYDVADRHFKFAITEVLKGKKTDEIVINAGLIGSSCYRGFTAGETYLVYAYRSSERVPDETMFAGMCTRTDRLTAGADDISFLRGLLQGKAEPVLYGSVARADTDPKDPFSSRTTYMSGITIVAESNQKQFMTVTDELGLYSFNNLPEGEYTVRPLVDAKYAHYWFKDEKVMVPDKGYGAFAEFWIGWNNRVEGKITDAAGNVLRRANVRLLSVDPPVDTMSPTYGTISDYLDQGKYEIQGTTPGRYVLAAEVYAPFLSGQNSRRTYCPQATDRADALTINLGETDKLQIDLKLSSNLKVGWVKGVMVWSDGRPVKDNAWVFLEKLEDPTDENNVRYDRAYVDKRGNFTLQVFENAQYWVRGEVSTMDLKFRGSSQDLWREGIREIRSKPIRIVGIQAGPLKIVIPLPAGLSRR